MSEARQPYPPYGSCIYCGQRPPAVTLSEEHIIPAGLRGNLIFPEASCSGEGSCAVITGRFEQEYMRVAQDGLRTFLGVFGMRRKKERRTTIPLKVWQDRQSDFSEEISLSPNQHPLWAAFFMFDPPELLSGLRAKRTVSINMVAMADEDTYKRYLAKYQSIGVSGSHDSGPLIKMLAKIAHSYAMAEYPHGSFAPCLTGLILDDDWSNYADLWPRYIGAATSPGPTFSPNLHEIALQPRTVNGRYFLVCTIRLFSCVPESPTYDVVVAEHWHSSAHGNIAFTARAATIERQVAPPQ